MSIALIIQGVLAAWLLPQIGLAGGTVSLVTILLGALLFGVRGGIITVFIAVLLNSALGSLLIDEPFFAFLRGSILIGVIAMTLIAAVVGHLTTLQNSLFNIRADLEKTVAQRTAALETSNQELRAEIVERKEAELTLQRTKTALEGASQARDHFLANISHELRTPLTMIMGQSDALQEGLYGNLNPDQLDAVEQVQQSSSHLLKLIDNILDYNRFSTKNVSLNRESVTIGPIYIAALQMVEHLANEKHIELLHEDHTNDASVDVDEVKVTQMIVNLLDNAIKFTPVGGQVGLLLNLENAAPATDADSNREPYPSLSMGPDDKVLEIVVWDTGIGMSHEDTIRVFEPFVQAMSSETAERSGTGLGLSLVRQMVDLHNGTIEVESQPNRGSRFTIKLPAQATSKTALLN